MTKCVQTNTALWRPWASSAQLFAFLALPSLLSLAAPAMLDQNFWSAQYSSAFKSSDFTIITSQDLDQVEIFYVIIILSDTVMVQ